jgi:hypothetical protein
MLSCMQETTTIRVSASTRDALHVLAARHGVTLDQAIERLLRSERQSRMGAALAGTELSEDERAWLDLGAGTLGAPVTSSGSIWRAGGE